MAKTFGADPPTPLPGVLVNCTACSVGGGVQVAAGFVNHLVQAKLLPFRPILALSRPVERECQAALAKFPCIVTDDRPGALFSGHRARRAVRGFADTNGVAAVFTVLGPSYVRFAQPEIVGFADGFAFAADDECYLRHPFAQRMKARLLKPLKLHFLRNRAAYWVEAPVAKDNLARALPADPATISVIPNCPNQAMLSAATGASPSRPASLLLLAAGYWHKNHELAAPMAAALRRMAPDLPFRLRMTLPEGPIWRRVSALARKDGVADLIENLGPLSLAGCARAMEEATLILHPSLLETFSATYLEAMGIGRPLLVSDRRFARDVCGDAALYFDPLSPEDAATKALGLLRDPSLRSDLVEKGRARLALYPSPGQKNEALVGLVSDLLHHG